MNNIQVSASSDGSSPYTFAINPMDADFQDGSDIVSVPTLHGSMVWHESTWDGRPRTLSWRRVGAVASVEPSIASQYSTMEGWIGSIKYFNFNDLSSVVSWPVDNTWKRARVINLVGQLEPETSLRYSKLELIIQPEQ